MDINNSIWIYNCDILKEELLFRKDNIQQEFIDHGIISPTIKYILIPIRKEKVKKLRIGNDFFCAIRFVHIIPSINIIFMKK